MRAVDIIHNKRNGESLLADEIEAFVQGATAGSWPDYQVAALLMAIFLRGMNQEETSALTRAMVHTGNQLDLSDIPGFKVDKHSTGGVGDKTSMILVPLAAACGCIVPKMSGRSLGHSGGTLDKLESIPGFRTDLNIGEFRRALHNVGGVLAGQTTDIAPADKVLYALRDVTATVESIPLIASSVMSQKIAEGIEGLVLDVKCGKGAFMKSETEARELARSLVAIGAANDVKTVALLTAMDAPLGFAVGNALEVVECVETLKGNGPADLERLSIILAAEMLQLARPDLKSEQSEQEIREALTSGRGLQKLTAIIEQQGGDAKITEDYGRLPAAPKRFLFRAKQPGTVSGIHAERVGQATMLLGAGREKKQDRIDHGVGIVLKVRPGEHVSANEPLAEIHYRDETRLVAARGMFESAIETDESGRNSREQSGQLVIEKVE